MSFGADLVVALRLYGYKAVLVINDGLAIPGVLFDQKKTDKQTGS